MRRRAGAAVAALGLAGLGLLPGCSKKATPAARESAPKPAIPSLYALDPAKLGAISGVVKFMGTPPPPVRGEGSADPCAGGGSSSEELAVADGRLANVYVYVKSGPAAAMTMGAAWMEPVVLDQQGCRFVPHVVAVMVGQRVELRNDDRAMRMVHALPSAAGNARVDVMLAAAAQPLPARSAGQVRMFRKPEAMMPVRSDGHPGMSAYINVSPTPFFAVTGADGRFELKGLPAGEYTLGFVQEKMGERTVNVTVKAQATTVAGMTYSL